MLLRHFGRRAVVIVAAVLAVAAHASAQSGSTSTTPSLRTVLSAEEFRRAGLGKLTDEELAFLSRLVLESGASRSAVLGAPPSSADTTEAVTTPAPTVASPAPSVMEATDAVVTGEPVKAPPQLPQKSDGEAAFGREDELRREAERARQIPTSIETEISGTFRGWDGHTTFTLTNGQIWQQIEDGTFSVRLHDPQVTIEKAALGAFYLRVEGYGSRVKVRRIK